MYNFCVQRNERDATMNKKEEIINRIEKLTEEQFELFIYLYSQQEQESAPTSQVENQTFLPHAL